MLPESFQTHCRVNSNKLFVNKNAEIHLERTQLVLLRFLAFKPARRMHYQSFLHWVVALVWGVLEMATLIHTGHLQNLFLDDVQSSYHLPKVLFIGVYPRFMENHFINYIFDIRRKFYVFSNTNTHHLVNFSQMQFEVLQTGFEVDNIIISTFSCHISLYSSITCQLKV